MISRSRPVGPQRMRTKRIGLSTRGDLAPRVYMVTADVFQLVEKMLAANHLIGPYSGLPLFEFEEVRFLLNLLGVCMPTPSGDEMFDVALWIPED